jgi:hypothetical protein
LIFPGVNFDWEIRLMKKIFVALLTFAIGVFAFGLFNFQSSFNNEKDVFAPDLNSKFFTTIDPVSENQSEKSQQLKTETVLPFFKSFSDDEGYSGWLMADDLKDMKEVWTIRLWRDSGNSKSEKLSWSADILRNDIDYNVDDADDSFIWIKTENNKLSFRTKKYRNVEYRFDGEFFKDGKTFAEGEKVLKGTLQKFVKGKKVAEFTSDFAYFEPRCFH